MHDDVRLVGQDLLEHPVEAREVRAATRATEDLPPPIAGRVEEGLESPRRGVRVLDPLAFRERVPEQHDADDPRRLGRELPLAEEERVVAELDREGGTGRDLVHAAHAAGFVRTADLGRAEVDVEVAAGIARIAVEEQALARDCRARRGPGTARARTRPRAGRARPSPPRRGWTRREGPAGRGARGESSCANSHPNRTRWHGPPSPDRRGSRARRGRGFGIDARVNVGPEPHRHRRHGQRAGLRPRGRRGGPRS